MSFTSVEPRWRDVGIVSIAKMVSYCGDFLAATALALALQARGDEGYGVAALLIASTLPLAVLAPLAGRLADRVDSRLLLVVTGLVQAIVCAVLAYTQHPMTMIALVAVLSAGLAVTQPTLSALIPDMVGRDQLPKAMSIGQTAGALGMLAGPALGGVLVGSSGLRLPLLIDAVTYLALAVAGLAIQTRRGGRAARTAAMALAAENGDRHTPDEVPADALTLEGQRRPDFPEAGAPAGGPSSATSWRFRDDQLLVTLATAFTAVIAAVTAISVVEIFFVRETLGGSAAMYGLVSGAWMAGVLFGAWPLSKVKGDDSRLVTLGLVALLGVSIVVLGSAAVPDAYWLLPIYVVGGMCNAGLNVLTGVVVGRRVPSAVRGRAAGVFAGAANCANLVGYALGGILTPIFPPRALIAGTGLLGLAVATAFLLTAMARSSRTALASSPAAVVGYRHEA